jgi:Asp-tRNA(Asn)/Glu-tRNA(Gln) amidotransferase A subunit family amidase
MPSNDELCWLQMVGRRFADAAVLRAAAAFEVARPWAERRPSLA